MWLVLFGAVLAWEGLALARVTGVPTLSDVFRVIMRYPVGRWALFAFWLWARWLGRAAQACGRYRRRRVPAAAAGGVVGYYFGVARVGPGFLESAFTGTALLLGLAVPVFAACPSWPNAAAAADPPGARMMRSTAAFWRQQLA